MSTFRIGNLGAVVEAAEAIEAVRAAVADGRLRGGTVYVWPVDAGPAARVVFEVHGGGVSTRADFEAAHPPPPDVTP